MKLLKNALIFGSGAGIGAATAIIIMKKQYFDKLEGQVEEIKAQYKDRWAKNNIEKAANRYKSDETEIKEPENEEKEDFVRASKDDRTDYTGFSEELKTKKKVNSEVITMEEYTEENGFDKLSFSVFREGMTFINVETNKENKSIAKIITKTILDENDDVDELYVRNVKEKKDIELIFHDCSYLDWLKEERD